MVLAGAGLGLLGLFPGFEWLEAVVIGVETTAYFLPTLCATDPPSMPTFTDAEYLAALTNARGSDYDSFVSKFSDLLENLAWHAWCKCDSGAQPAGPAAPVQPSGTQPVPAVQPCFTLDSGFVSLPTIGSVSAVPILGSSADLSDNTTAIPIPVGMTSWDATVTRSASGSNHGTITMSGAYWADNITGLGTLGGFTSVVVTTSSAQTISQRETIPATARFMKVSLNSATHPLDDLGRVQIIGGCYGNPPGSSVSPCFPTGDVTSLLLALKAQVDRLQQQLVPIAYAAGTVHSGLSGAGALSISDLFGVKVAITTLPSSYGAAGTSPTEHFGLGFITFGTVDGFRSSYRVEHNPQLMLPARASGFTDLDYDLAPGLVVTITELHRSS
jgi:hypothetical protein